MLEFIHWITFTVPYFQGWQNLESKLVDFFAFINCVQIVSFGGCSTFHCLYNWRFPSFLSTLALNNVFIEVNLSEPCLVLLVDEMSVCLSSVCTYHMSRCALSQCINAHALASPNMFINQSLLVSSNFGTPRTQFTGKLGPHCELGAP